MLVVEKERIISDLPLVGGYKIEGEETQPKEVGLLEMITQLPILIIAFWTVVCALMAAIPEVREAIINFR